MSVAISRVELNAELGANLSLCFQWRTKKFATFVKFGCDSDSLKARQTPHSSFATLPRRLGLSAVLILRSPGKSCKEDCVRIMQVCLLKSLFNT